mmetsp:Transcript_11006/g.45866  ORF Transcript_11006/g.45866 Transcript_11006/m.45866 type:complete len:257 (-) Transcript_11006:2403-3173(-)
MSPSRIALMRGPSSHANGAAPFLSTTPSAPSSPSTSSASAPVGRVGLNPPRKSPVSVCWWQLRIRSFCPRRSARSWHTDVLPQPVSPTKRAGSLWFMHASTSENSRRIAGVHAIASDSCAASEASCFADLASAAATALEADFSASSALFAARAAASSSLSLRAPSSAAAYMFSSSRGGVLSTLASTVFIASRSSSDLSRSPKTRKPSAASSSYPLLCLFAHLNKSRAVMKPSLPANALDACLRRCSSRMTSTSFAQ